MKKLITATLVLCMALLPVLALADSTLTARGNATLRVTPDIAILSVGYAGEDSDSSAAQQKTADAITAVVKALTALGIEDADIVTSYLNTYPVYNYTDEAQTLRGYRVEHMLAVTIRNLDIVGDALDASLRAGANQSNSIEYKSSLEKDVYLQALALAIENAAVKADAMAIATGVWLGGLEQINEATDYGMYRYGNEAQYDGAEAKSLGGTLMTGDLEVTATVELVYEIR